MHMLSLPRAGVSPLRAVGPLLGLCGVLTIFSHRQPANCPLERDVR